MTVDESSAFIRDMFIAGTRSGNFSSVKLFGTLNGQDLGVGGASLEYYAASNTWQTWSSIDPLTGKSYYYAGLDMNSGLVTIIPEPSTYALFGLGAIVMMVAYRRKQKAIAEG